LAYPIEVRDRNEKIQHALAKVEMSVSLSRD